MSNESTSGNASKSTARGVAVPTERAYVDIDRLSNSNHIVAVISQRKYDGEITFNIFREFPRDGKMVPSAFIPESLMPAYDEMLQITKDRIRQLRAAGGLPFPTRSVG